MKAKLHRFKSSPKVVVRLVPETEEEARYLRRAERLGELCWNGSWYAGKRLTSADFDAHPVTQHKEGKVRHHRRAA